MQEQWARSAGKSALNQFQTSPSHFLRWLQEPRSSGAAPKASHGFVPPSQAAQAAFLCQAGATDPGLPAVGCARGNAYLPAGSCRYECPTQLHRSDRERIGNMSSRLYTQLNAAVEEFKNLRAAERALLPRCGLSS